MTLTREELERLRADKQQRHADASAAVAEALELIESAQRRLGRAAELLSPVEGGAPDHARTMRLYDQVHDHWRRIAYNAGHSARGAATARRLWLMALYWYENRAARP